MRYRRQVFTQRGGHAVAGIADRPTHVLGIAVRDVILVRADAPAALVRLADGRFAVTGVVAAAGSARDLTSYFRRRAMGSLSRADRSWFGACSRALAEVHPRVAGPGGVLRSARTFDGRP